MFIFWLLVLVKIVASANLQHLVFAQQTAIAKGSNFFRKQGILHGDKFYTFSNDKFYEWDITTGIKTKTFYDSNIDGYAFASDFTGSEEIVVSYIGTRILAVWNLTSATVIRKSASAMPSQISQLRYVASSNTLLVSAYNNRTYFYVHYSNLTVKQNQVAPLMTGLDFHTFEVSSDGKWVFDVLQDQTLVRIFDTATRPFANPKNLTQCVRANLDMGVYFVNSGSELVYFDDCRSNQTIFRSLNTTNALNQNFQRVIPLTSKYEVSHIFDNAKQVYLIHTSTQIVFYDRLNDNLYSFAVPNYVQLGLNSLWVSSDGRYILHDSPSSTSISKLSCENHHYFSTTARDCVSCDSACLSCSGYSGICLSCPALKYISGMTCLACDANCLNCSSSNGTCTQCASNYYKSGLNCLACDVNCITCASNNGVCSLCQANFYKSGINCLACDSHCANCNPNNGSCGQCSPNYYPTSAGSITCQPCNTNCLNCYATNGNCLQCDTGYYISGINCLACPSNCTNCDGNTGNCLQCDAGYFVLNNGCSQCGTDCTNCSDNTGTCDECQAGHYVSPDGTNCQICSLPSYCLSCNSTDGSCVQCQTGYHLNATICSIDTVPANNTNANTTDSSTNNIDMPINCAIFDSSKMLCTQCSEQYYPDENTCWPCRDNCQKCNPRTGVCQTCQQGYFINDRSCSVCAVRCVQCNGTDGTCLQSQTGFFLNDDGNAIRCRTPCETCQNSATDCLSCARFYQLNDHGQCVLSSDYPAIQVLGSAIGGSLPSNIKAASFLFAYLDQLWPYYYHNRNYGNNTEELLATIHTIENSRWFFFNLDKKVNNLYSYLPFSDYTSYSNQKFIQRQQKTTFFWDAAFEVVLYSLPATLMTYLLARMCFRVLFNYRISRYIRNYAFIFSFFQILFQGNLIYLAYVTFSNISVFFSFQQYDKVGQIGWIIVFYILVMHSFAFYFLAMHFYQKLAKYFIPDAYFVMSSFILCTIHVARAFLMGAVQHLLHHQYTWLLLSMSLIQIITMGCMVVFEIKFKCFKQAFLVHLYILNCFMKLLLNLVLWLNWKFSHQFSDPNNQLAVLTDELAVKLIYIGSIFSLAKIVGLFLGQRGKKKDSKLDAEFEEESFDESQQSSEASSSEFSSQNSSAVGRKVKATPFSVLAKKNEPMVPMDLDEEDDREQAQPKSLFFVGRNRSNCPFKAGNFLREKKLNTVKIFVNKLNVAPTQSPAYPNTGPLGSIQTSTVIEKRVQQPKESTLMVVYDTKKRSPSSSEKK